MTYTCPKDPSHQSTDPDYCSVCGAKLSGAPSALTSSVSAAAAIGVAPPVAGGELCPDCGTPRVKGAKFCEVCRYNFDQGVSAPADGSQAVLIAPAVAPAPPATPPSPDSASAIPLSTATGAPPVSVSSPAVAAAASPDAVLPVGSPLVPEPNLAPPGDTASGLPGPAAASNALLKWQVVVTVDPSLYTDPDPSMPLPTDEPERTFPLDFAENLIGRRSDRRDIHPEVPLNDPGVSHRHAKLLREPDGSFTLLDVGSTNGTQLNGVDVTPGVRLPVRDGDQITLGCWTRITVRTYA